MISPKLRMGTLIGWNSEEPREEHLLYQCFVHRIRVRW